jgi:hypothetical protein
MRYLKLFESFENIDSICWKYNIKDYIINSDGSIDVYGHVDSINLPSLTGFLPNIADLVPLGTIQIILCFMLQISMFYF